MRVSAVLALLCTLLLGCVTTPRPPPPTGDFSLRLSPASLGRELSLSQRITVLRGDERHSFDAQLEADASAVRIAAVSLGQTIASLQWDGVTLAQQVSTHVPPAVTADRILSDVQLAWWPAAAIRAALRDGFTLEEGEGQRSLLLDGAPFASVRYTGTAPAWAHVLLTHQRYGYALDIESVEAAP